VLRDLEKQKSHTVCHDTSRGARFYGAAAALNPQSSFKIMELTFALAQAALLADGQAQVVQYVCTVYSLVLTIGRAPPVGLGFRGRPVQKCTRPTGVTINFPTPVRQDYIAELLWGRTITFFNMQTYLLRVSTL
jgi:hypothetical protein